MKRAVSRFLNHEVAAYELKVPNDMARISRDIRKGDVMLVEGTLRISQLVKYVTQSQWSHSAFYVGDELLRRGGRLRQHALASFGEFADRLLVEALTDEGVIAVPLEKYCTHNIRICRPSHIHPADLDRVVNSVVAGAAAPGSVLLGAGPHGSLRARHYSQTLPRDFDLSPNFDIVKFNTLGPYGLDAHLVLDRSVPETVPVCAGVAERSTS